MFRRILIWFAGMLVFSFVAFVVTSWLVGPGFRERDLMERLVEFELGEAVHAYQADGQAGVERIIARLDAQFPWAKHHLLDREGRDLAGGRDLSDLTRTAAARGGSFRDRSSNGMIFTKSSNDGKYVLLAEAPLLRDPWVYLVLYGWIVLVIVLLCYVLARTLATPIRRLRHTVVQFGQGDLTSRICSQRTDEIGDLSRSFDQMADRLETLLTAERRLLQDVSHELRSPLARLRFALHLARTSPSPGSALARADKEVDRLSTLIGDLLQMTRAEGDPGARSVAPVKVEQFLSGLVEDCRFEAEAHKCSISLSVENGLVWTGDRELLHRAVENLIRNAIRYAPGGSAVEVKASQQNNELILSVRDYGPGVPEDCIENIFRPFFRVEEDRGRDNGGGTGLGLAMAKRAIRLHEGQITATNANPGLLVQVSLPL